MRYIRQLAGAGALGFLFAAGGAWAGTWYVTVDGNGDAPTIQAAVEAATSGDTILVGPGRYTWTNQGSASGPGYGMIFLPREHSLTIRSEMGAAATILDGERSGRLVFLQGLNSSIFEGFTVTGGAAPVLGDYSGGGLAGHISTDIIRDCVFAENSAQHGAGIWIGGQSTTHFENCTIRNNDATGYGGGALFINSAPTITMTDCVVRNNSAGTAGAGIAVWHAKIAIDHVIFSTNTVLGPGGGIYARNMWPSTVDNCTFAENFAALGGGGIYVDVDSELSVNNTIVAYSDNGGGLGRIGTAVLSVGCSNVYGNIGGDTLPAGTIDLGGNISLNPIFCSPLGTQDYELRSDSPCLPNNHPGGPVCGTIGALGEGCSLSPVESTSWGALKALYGD